MLKQHHSRCEFFKFETWLWSYVLLSITRSSIEVVTKVGTPSCPNLSHSLSHRGPLWGGSPSSVEVVLCVTWQLLFYQICMYYCLCTVFFITGIRQFFTSMHSAVVILICSFHSSKIPDHCACLMVVPMTDWLLSTCLSCSFVSFFIMLTHTRTFFMDGCGDGDTGGNDGDDDGDSYILKHQGEWRKVFFMIEQLWYNVDVEIGGNHHGIFLCDNGYIYFLFLCCNTLLLIFREEGQSSYIMWDKL